MNITMKFRDPSAPNKATLYFDQLSLRLDPDYLIVLPPKTPVAAIVGGVIGGVALLLALLALFLFFMRRRKKSKAAGRQIPDPVEEPQTSANNLLNPQLLTVPRAHSGEPSISSAQREAHLGAHHRATSVTGASGTWNPGLPAYETPEDPISPTSDLESFAQLHRDSIDPSLFDKLRRAGYNPTQNPNVYTESEWYQQFGVTKFEYQRLCSAYSRSVQFLNPSFT
jgi:hypothetical protein